MSQSIGGMSEKEYQKMLADYRLDLRADYMQFDVGERNAKEYMKRNMELMRQRVRAEQDLRDLLDGIISRRKVGQRDYSKIDEILKKPSHTAIIIKHNGSTTTFPLVLRILGDVNHSVHGIARRAEDLYLFSGTCRLENIPGMCVDGMRLEEYGVVNNKLVASADWMLQGTQGDYVGTVHVNFQRMSVMLKKYDGTMQLK